MECDYLEHGGMAEAECKSMGNGALLVLLFIGWCL